MHTRTHIRRREKKKYMHKYVQRPSFIICEFIVLLCTRIRTRTPIVDDGDDDNDIAYAFVHQNHSLLNATHTLIKSTMYVRIAPTKYAHAHKCNQKLQRIEFQMAIKYIEKGKNERMNEKKKQIMIFN